MNMPPPVFQFLNSELIQMDDTGAVCRFRPSSAMENPFGYIQGGILAGMLDNVIGPATHIAASGKPTTTIQMSLNYLRGVRTTDVVIGRAQVIKRTRRQLYTEASLEREHDGELLVRASATNLILEPKE